MGKRKKGRKCGAPPRIHTHPNITRPRQEVFGNRDSQNIWQKVCAYLSAHTNSKHPLPNTSSLGRVRKFSNVGFPAKRSPRLFVKSNAQRLLQGGRVENNS